MQNWRLEYLFQKYINKNCTQEEYAELMLMIDQCDESVLQDMLDKAYNDLPDEHLSKHAAGKILNNILQTKTDRKRLWPPAKWILAAASIIIICTISIILFKSNRHAAPATALTRSKPSNDHRFIKFSDGSSVILNKYSYVKYPRKFTGSTREVSLTGEGYFDIRHDAGKPFLVHVGKLTITVLGTAFNINSTQKNIAVTVTRGKVSVSEHGKVLGAVTPNQQINYSVVNQKARQVTLNADQVIKWQADDIFFDDITMEKAAGLLENRFNTKITFENERVKHCTLTGTFTHGESLKEILKVICAFNNATYEEFPGRGIVIKGAGC
jgi:ferric-dicitrate binding protein FerR (iron transport regulator)